MLESRRLNQSLLESSTDCIKILNLEARLLFMNGLGCKALEIDDFASVANTYWLDFWKDTFADAARAAIESAKTGGFGRFRGYCPTWKGTPKWWDVVITRLLDAHEKPEYLLVVSRDVTEHKLIEERLRASEGRLMEAQHLAKVGSWERHIKNDTIDWSEEMLRILGLTNCAPSNLQTFLSYVHPKDREKILEADDQIRSSIAPVEVEYRIVRPDGEVRFVRSIVKGIGDDRGVPVRITGATQDVTEQVKVRELLRESEQRLKSAQQLTHVGSWHWNLEADRVVCSEECLRIFGQPDDYRPSLEGLLGMITPGERDRVAGELRGGIADKSGCATEFHIIRPNGEVRAINFTSQVLLDEKGLPQHIFGACQDVTDVRRAQEESISRQKLESVGTLASGIAHDFNNLLGGVLAQAELALAELASGSRPEEELKAIRNVAIRGAEIVRQLMIYAGKESEVSKSVDVSQIVKEMTELLKVSVSKHATLALDLRHDLPAVRGSAAQLRQVVLNLVTNASEAIAQDGVIRVTTSCVNVGRDSSGAISDRLAEGDYVQLEVNDTGCGMSRETQARIFDPFFSTKSTGHGLGLAVVDGIVRGLSGAIHLTSELGKGTTFRILMPAAENTTGTTSDPTFRTMELAGPPQDATVLIVEDEDPLRQAVARVLRQTGFEVFEASDGATAIDLLREKGGEIDVMLLDVTIPGPSFNEVIVEAVNARPDINVVLTSAYSQEMVMPSMCDPHIRAFIRKPFRLTDLVETLSFRVRGTAG